MAPVSSEMITTAFLGSLSLLLFTFAHSTANLPKFVLLSGVAWALVLAAGRLILGLVFAKKFKVNSKGGILISGASSGIGRSAALALDAAGFTIFPGVRKQADAESLIKERPTLLPLLLDVTSDESVNDAVRRMKEILEEKKISLVGLVNNAGATVGLPVELEPMKNVKKVYEVNVIGIFRLSRSCIPLLRPSQGRIVNISSLSAFIPRASKSVYTSTKFAVEGMSACLRAEVAKFKMSVSLVCPGFVKTRIIEKQIGEKLPFASLSEEEFNLYSHLFQGWEAKRIKQHDKGSTTRVTDEAILHALTSPYPKTRYIVAKAGALPAWLAAWAFWLLSDRVGDALMTTFN